jgi:hypothetical protein
MTSRLGKKDNILIHLSQKGKKRADYDVTSTSSYREAYFIANKNKVNTILNIDGSGSKISISVKKNKT